MRIAFVHLSDIHFGQERDGLAVVNDDVKNCLIDDCRVTLSTINVEKVGGVLVTGDIAYSGKKVEYDLAGQWLDRLTKAIDCERTHVQIVPGNHDIDRDTLSESTKDMLAAIAAHGEEKLTKYLKDEGDRDRLFARFSDYRLFAEAYDCSLDNEGGLAGSRVVQLANGRTLRFVGVNSALICAANDTEGRLLLGKRQWVLPRTVGEELVVLTHHPMNWFQDSEDAVNYVMSRARVYLSGHEHHPAVHIEPVEGGGDLMRLAAGATVPPKIENGVNYCYNILIFSWVEEEEALSVQVLPRAWNKKITAFDDASDLLKGQGPHFKLACPNFRDAKGFLPGPPTITAPSHQRANPSTNSIGANMGDQFADILLRYFRDLNEKERLAILIKLSLLPAEWKGPLSHVLERRCLDRARATNLLTELEAAITGYGK
ncbi:metallophosphoesterase [Azonexus sp. R2A61]|uniref:metallophosphoesterase n=1 Tax=Azonexus sp. R2A61 TaxID=2744443 RepID=UPI001F4421AF|nr:metallophosphoesterase [Azonexus sp. R2A61]